MITVLVVDHSSEARSAVIGLLNGSGSISAVYMPGCTEALDYLEKQTPEIILVDLPATGSSPLEFLGGIRNRSPFVPVVLLTQPGAEELLVKALRQGASGFVSREHVERDLKPTLETVLTLARKERRYQSLVGYMMESESSFDLENDQSLVPILVGCLQEGLVRMKLCDSAECVQVGIALGEALLNALFHGNLEVSSDLRNSDHHAYYALAEARRHEAPYKDRRIHVTARMDRRQAVYVVRDEGQGFDASALPDPTDPANLEKASGRGILLIQSFMDEVTFNTAGNQITMVKKAGLPLENAKCGP